MRNGVVSNSTLQLLYIPLQFYDKKLSFSPKLMLLLNEIFFLMAAEQKRVSTFLGQHLKITSSSLSEKGLLGETGFTAEEVPETWVMAA